MEKITTVYLVKDVSGNIVVLDFPVEGAVEWTRADTVKNLLSKAYQAGLDGRNEPLLGAKK